ncbi:MAG: DUF4350 domain-containing protein [Ignavibacteria bacterium]|nr:DUF4350 domain-containing protein [Ignavibacteria bacterium]
MKSQRKFIIILGIVFVAMVVFEFIRPKPIDWRQTYSQFDKIPFGSYILYRILPHIFPEAHLETVREPLYNTLPETDPSSTLYLSISKTFAPDDLDTKALLEFVENGGVAFLSADNFSGALTDSLKFKLEVNYAAKFSDSNYLHFTSPALSTNGKEWGYKGGTATNFLVNFDTTDAVVTAVSRDSQVVMIEQAYGEGTFIISTTPICFTNYYVLAGDNRDFISKAFSKLYGDTVLWDEYYKVGRDEIRSPFRYILSVEPLRWAYYCVLLGGVLFVIFRAKRDQRIIPVIPPVTNSTLEFVDTVGQVYYQQGDHANLAEKKILYFLDFVRVNYYVRTNEFTEEFFQKVSEKSGIDLPSVRKIFRDIERIRGKEKILEVELESLHTNIEQFYTWGRGSR